MACKVIDWAMQVHGGGGDGPDEVHRNMIAKMEIGKYAGT